MQDVQTFIDEALIRKVHLRYCRGVDRMDWDLVRSCYHPEATDEHGSYSGGIEGFIDWVSVGMTKFESTAHFTGNQLVEVTGDTAWAEHYAVVFHRRAASADQPAADLIVNVRYVDRMERRDGEWRIAKRVVIADSEKIETIEGSWLNLALLQPSRRDASDYSYVR
ncbi:aromatic-ring-hydroxylating dioxygenase [Sphingomonas sp. Leaf357]|uniref:nuclear transport factor 2 family protein n=1 Tax=Sphingomonas sp. Leaf357 TaxID=1736350 RepID=UPI0006F9E69F|nr:nuclear transport factor 2 family protein [Sphingomonas sp. Leaf357]KQS03616.1 aromatic-ring-hydroxylating dioxygenase [Sphingomonas sp. Leaf357]